ncbi:diglucosyl diacylglycerol synthase, partial [Bacillus haynesii]|nr:diglucosyl diacylglycerol synthase [Bacillus haynesii]
ESVSSLLADEKKLNEMKKNIKSLHLSNSSEVILTDIIEQSEIIMNKKQTVRALS